MAAELLSPAGDIESGYAAFHYGAEAVYLGLGRFSARAEATNFTPSELQNLAGYARSLNKKVLVAVNTVAFDSEIPALIDVLSDVAEAGANGVIVQDLGVAALIRRYFPTLRLHASTQLAVHNKAGVKALRDLGFKRVVLARELSLEEIEDIKKSVKDIEIEVFVHGALCYCYSGLCLFSATYTGRSANRGKCVYPCREEFSIEGMKKHPFSMKDLAQGANVLKLQKAGVNALKIEGRKKSPLYVAAVTDYYRSLLDGEKDPHVLNEKLNAIRCIFSRPTTTLYFDGIKNRAEPVDPDIVGHRGLFLGTLERIVSVEGRRAVRFTPEHPVSRYDGIQIDVQKAERPFGFSAERLRTGKKDVFRAEPHTPVDIVLPDNAPYFEEGCRIYLSSSSAVKSAYPYDRPKPDAYLPATAADVSVFIEPDGVSAVWEDVCVKTREPLSAAKTPELVEKSVRSAFEKTGGTGLVLQSLRIENPQGLFAPASLLNAVRRDLYAKVSEVVKERKFQNRENLKASILKDATPETGRTPPVSVSYSVKTDDPSIFTAFEQNELSAIREFIIDLFADVSDLPLPADKIRRFLPVIARNAELPRIERRLASLYEQGCRRFEISNVWGFEALKQYPDCDIAFDWPLYAANSYAASFLAQKTDSYFTVSPESETPEVLFGAFPDKASAVIHQDMPLFVSETCPKASSHGECQKCGGNYEETISSRYGRFVSVAKNCRQFLLNEKPHIKTAEAEKAGAKLMRLDFINRKTPPEKAAGIFRRLTRRTS